MIASEIHEIDYGFRDALVLAAAEREEAIKRARNGRVHELQNVRLLAPVAEGGRGLTCIGINYLEHQQESADVFVQAVPTKPIVFMKPPTAIAAPNDDLPLLPSISSEFDWEVELGVVIGAPGRDVTPEKAEELIAGYTIVNDVTARDLQREHVQWFMGKSVDRATPVGPWVVTVGELGPSPDLTILLSVNGQLKQRGCSSEMLFDPRTLISAVSRVTTLLPGDVIATGTPSGVGFKRVPPEFLGDGDVLDASIERIGTLRNRVVHEGVPVRHSSTREVLNR